MAEEAARAEHGLRLQPATQNWPRQTAASTANHPFNSADYNHLNSEVTRLKSEQQTTLARAWTVLDSARDLRAHVANFVAAADEAYGKLSEAEQETSLGEFVKEWADMLRNALEPPAGSARCKLSIFSWFVRA